ncbi:MAG: hypothetical protein QOF71_3286 [Candidatus Eremiobacteraeota bacterium]|nr:hypothetical protein [Candidatus Eremiobacteraeota bacterium]
MSSLDDGGIKFMAYPQDHEPRHVHGLVGGIGGPEVIVDLKMDGTVGFADRDDAVRGANRAEVRKVLAAADRRFVDLVALWHAMHVG